MSRTGIGLAALFAGLALPGLALGASITPDTFEATIGVGETTTVDKTITTDEGGATKIDVFFLADNTGSMGGVVSTAQARASDILNSPEFDGVDIGFGVGRYFGDPSEFGEDGGSAYDVLQTITTNTADAQTGIDGWIASGGGDGPEANLYALQQAATEGADADSGIGSGEATGWRAGAQRVIAWFGDVVGHQDTVPLTESIEALTDAGVIVTAFNSNSENSGIDGAFADGTADSRNQASAITDGTGGALLNNFTSLTSDETVDAVVAAIGEAAATVDLDFLTTGDTSGLDISFECTDDLGCDDVAGGESRDFRMTVTGVETGIFEFEVSARGVDAIEVDRITVGDGGTPTPVPAPATLLLLGSGLLGMSLMSRRRRVR